MCQLALSTDRRAKVETTSKPRQETKDEPRQSKNPAAGRTVLVQVGGIKIIGLMQLTWKMAL